MTSFKRTSSVDKDFRNLVALLDADLKTRDGDEHLFYDQFNKIENIRHAIVCYIEKEPVGCGAFKEFNREKAEIKRMFILPEHRGKGIGIKLLAELELWALELNYKECILETGKKQPEAIRLYQKAGYKIISNYGQYANIENSVCMKKSIF